MWNNRLSPLRDSVSLFHNIFNDAGPLGKSLLFLTPRDSVKLTKFDHFAAISNSTYKTVY